MYKKFSTTYIIVGTQRAKKKIYVSKFKIKIHKNTTHDILPTILHSV